MADSLQASIDALDRLKDEIRRGYRDFPDLYYGILDGEAVSNGGVAYPQADGSHRTLEDYLKEHVAQGKPYLDSVGWKHPRYFFFGNDADAGVERLATIARALNKIIRDGLDAVGCGLLPDPVPFHGDDVPEHEWLYWMIYLGDKLDNPMLKPKRKPIAVHESGMAPLPTAASQAHFARFKPVSLILFAPTINGTIGLPWQQRGDRDGAHGAAAEWEAVLDAAKDDTLGPITIFDTAVFLASEIAVDVLIKLAQDQQAEAAAVPDLSDLLTDLDPTKALPPAELAEHFGRLADDLDAARYVADPLRRNAADLAQAARLLYRDTTMDKREVEPGQFQWVKRTTTTLDGRRREYHLAQALTLLSDVQDGRRPDGISGKLRAVATGIKTTFTTASPPMPPSAAGSTGQADAGELANAGTTTSANSPTLQEPPAQAFVAYRAHRILGQKQTDVATALSVNQGQVSRWVKQVSEWIEAGNVLPNLPTMTTKPAALDPAVIEMGERQDGRTKRQRSKRKADTYDGDDDAAY